MATIEQRLQPSKAIHPTIAGTDSTFWSGLAAEVKIKPRETPSGFGKEMPTWYYAVDEISGIRLIYGTATADETTASTAAESHQTPTTKVYNLLITPSRLMKDEELMQRLKAQEGANMASIHTTDREVTIKTGKPETAAKFFHAAIAYAREVHREKYGPPLKQHE